MSEENNQNPTLLTHARFIKLNDAIVGEFIKFVSLDELQNNYPDRITFGVNGEVYVLFTPVEFAELYDNLTISLESTSCRAEWIKPIKFSVRNFYNISINWSIKCPHPHEISDLQIDFTPIVEKVNRKLADLPQVYEFKLWSK